MILGKILPGKLVPETHRNKKSWGGRRARGVCVENWDVTNLWKHKTRQRTQNSETENRGASVEHRGVCVCVRVWNARMWSFSENPKPDNKPSWTPLVYYSFIGIWVEIQVND